MGPLGVLRTVRGVRSIRKPASPYWDVRAGGLCLLVSGRILHPSSTEMPRGEEAQQLHHVVHTYHKMQGQNFGCDCVTLVGSLSADLPKPCPTSREGGGSGAGDRGGVLPPLADGKRTSYRTGSWSE